MKPVMQAGLVVAVGVALAFGCARPTGTTTPAPVPDVASVQLPMLDAYTEEP